MTPIEHQKNQKNHQVLVVGSLNIDLSVSTQRIPQGGETVTGSPLTTSPGGKSANQAVAAASMGADVTLIGSIGDDTHGRFVADAVASRGVDTSHLVIDPTQPTGSALITVDENAENTIVVSPGANANLQPENIPEEILAHADIISLTLEIPPDTVARVARRGHQSGATVVLNLSPHAEVPQALLQDIGILLINEHELAALIGEPTSDKDWKMIRGALQDRGIRTTVVTLGPQGCVILENAAIKEIPGVNIEAIDTTGSGDGFAGALLAALSRGDTLHSAAKLANTVGAYTATRRGAQSSYPTTSELQRWRDDASPKELLPQARP